MAAPRPQQLTLPNTIVDVVETTVVDAIAVNSGTCTGNFQTGSLSTNTISATGAITSDHLVANSGTLAGKTTADTFQSNNGTFLTSLTVSGVPVSLTGGGGISSVSQDTSPVLGGNLNANSNSISGVNALTANTGNFPISCTAGSFIGNTISLSLSATADHIIANSGTFTGKLISNSQEAPTGTFSSSLTISGIPVEIGGPKKQLIYYFNSGGPVASVNTPSSPRLYNNTMAFIQSADLKGCTEIRFEANQIAGGTGGVRFACNGKTGSFSSTVGDYTSVALGGENGELSFAGNGPDMYRDTGWLTLYSPFKGECYLALVTSGGNGNTDPSLAQVKVSAR